MRQSRNTIQRELVLAAVRGLHTHPTAEEIYAHVAAGYPSISKATVYRNLALLARQGEIRRVSHLATADRFDFELREHYHFHCIGCDGVFDVQLDTAPALLAGARAGEGFTIEECDVVFSGRCPQCGKNGGAPC